MITIQGTTDKNTMYSKDLIYCLALRSFIAQRGTSKENRNFMERLVIFFQNTFFLLFGLLYDTKSISTDILSSF